MKKKYKVYLCDRSEIRDFIEEWHYSHSINGVMSTFCFKLMDGDKLIGAAIFGRVGMANAWRKYTDSPDKILELRRLCLIDDTERFAETFFIGKMLRTLRELTTIEIIISYADKNKGHTGIIYKASNFSFLGETAAGKVIEFNGKTWHDKTIRTKYNGKLKPFAQKIKSALESGEARYVPTVGKNIYIYSFQ